MSDVSLPIFWAEVNLQEITEVIRGITYKKEHSRDEAFSNSIGLLRATNISGRALNFDKLVHVPASYVSEIQILKSGDVVIASSSGSRDLVGKAGQYFGVTSPISFGAFCTTLRVDSNIEALYFGYYFQTDTYRQAVSNLSAGSNINNLKVSDLTEHRIPLAPRQTQTRIVEKLEELLSDLDAGVAELKEAQKKLGQYCQSLLKAAVEGTLTASWREQQRGNQVKRGALPETGAQLLQRILHERRTRWEAKQLAKFQQQGKIPSKDWQAKYPEPVVPDTSNLPTLPEGWVWASLDQLTEFITSGSRGWAEYYATEGATFIRSQNINKDVLDLTDIAFVNPPRSCEGARTLVRLDDLLLTITGANVGKAAMVNIELSEAYVSQHVALIRPIEAALSRYLHLYLTAGAGGRGQLNKEAYGAGKPGLNLQQVASVAIPISCQKEILALLEKLTAQLEAFTEQSSAIGITLKQSAAQRKNILKAAFSGKLVPQDPNDEPASMLLERIRKERAEREKRPKVRNDNPRRKAA